VLFLFGLDLVVVPAGLHAGPPEPCVSQFARMSGDELEALVAGVVGRSRGKDFFDVRSKMLREKSAASAVEKWNSDLIVALTAPLPATPQRLPSMSRPEADDLYRYLSCHPVAGMRHIRKYDPKGNFGFCFGRATAVHLEALRRGLARPRIMKIWGVGPMKGGWGHHVATLVAAKEGGWWAIDPEIGRVVSGTEWIQWLKSEQENAANPLVFFVSEAERFGPSPGKYTATDLYGSGTEDIYNGYFRDLIEEAPGPKRSAP
jgi:hypothetical protein